MQPIPEAVYGLIMKWSFDTSGADFVLGSDIRYITSWHTKRVYKVLLIKLVVYLRTSDMDLILIS